MIESNASNPLISMTKHNGTYLLSQTTQRSLRKPTSTVDDDSSTPVMSLDLAVSRLSLPPEEQSTLAGPARSASLRLGDAAAIIVLVSLLCLPIVLAAFGHGSSLRYVIRLGGSLGIAALLGLFVYLVTSLMRRPS